MNFHVHDSSIDPTGTTALRQSFIHESNARWNALIRLCQKMFLAEPDLIAFQKWFDEALKTTVLAEGGAWTAPYIEQAAALAVKRATTLTHDRALKNTLYISRDVLNADEICNWAKANGFETTLPADDMHVTVVYSKAPVDWSRVPYHGNDNISLEGGSLARFGDAVVMTLVSSALQRRHDEVASYGASWDHSSYTPHVTISWNATNVDIDKIPFYTGPIILGPEVFKSVNENWKSNITEDFDPNEPRNQSGEWTIGGGIGSTQSRALGSASLEQAQSEATRAAGGYQALIGLPTKPLIFDNEWYVPGPLGIAKRTAEQYVKSAGIDYHPPTDYVHADKERATRIATAFDQMAHSPDDPRVKASYDALAKETLAQWQEIKKTGLDVEWIKPGQPDPYASSPRLAAIDVSQNNHWWGFPTDQGFGSGAEAEAARHNNPMLAETNEVIDGRKCVVNDIFRIVHDYFGHFKDGNGFRADGEENAWRSHSAMYSDLARGAMTSETRGQNSWVNFGPYGAQNRTASAGETHYAPQKIGLMPEWTWNEGRTTTRDAYIVDAYDPDEDEQADIDEMDRVKRRAAWSEAIAAEDASSPLDILQQVTVSELQGICDATVQQVQRAIAHDILIRRNPAHDVTAIIDSVGAARSQMMINHMVVKTFAAITLDVFRARGVKRVGTVAESLNSMFTDAARNQPQKRHSRTGKFIKYTPKPSPRKMKQIFTAQKRFRAIEGSQVNVETAGDDRVCDVCDGIAANGPYDINEALSLIPAHLNCLLGDSFVLSRSGITATSERYYRGDIIVIKTASGRELSCTPNHPILTNRGFIAAQLLNLGDQVISDAGSEWEVPSVINDNKQNVPTCIHEIASAFSKHPQMFAMKMPTTSPHFHGDGIDGEIAIIRANRKLLNRIQPAFNQHSHQNVFIWRNIWQRILFGFGTIVKFIDRTFRSANSIMRGNNLVLSGFGAHSTPFDNFRFRLITSFYSMNFKNLFYSASLNIESIGKRIFRNTNEIISHDYFLDRVTFRATKHFAGHVYNLQTPTGYYSANGIVTHNCRCVFTPAEDSLIEEEE